jgi:hypothetical protein
MDFGVDPNRVRFPNLDLKIPSTILIPNLTELWFIKNRYRYVFKCALN